MRCIQCGVNASPQIDFYRFCKTHEAYQCPDCDVTNGSWFCADCCQREDVNLELSDLIQIVD